MNNFDLNDRVAIITGGAQGFGFAIAKRFISSGAKVIIWDINEEVCKEAVKEIDSKNFTYKIVDVRNFKSVSNSILEVDKNFGKIDIFINNAVLWLFT